jgi:LuxR family maltose regulon positive regulatory protein
MHKYPVKLSKLRPPVVSADALARPQLLRALHEAAQSGCRLSLLSAPLGYGKSTLMAQYVAALSTPWAWLRCDEADNQPLHLLMHLHRALGLDEASAALSNTEQLWASISSHFEQQTVFTLVLDDLQCLRATASIGYLNDLLRHAPAGLQVLAASQGVVKIALSHLRRDACLQVIERHQFELSSSEVEALAATRGLSIASSVAYHLCGISEGWISGILLGLEACSGSPQPVSQISAAIEQQAQNWVAQFFMDEVLLKLPTATLHMLERLSLVSAWDEALAINLSERSDAGMLLERLVAADLFIQHCADERLPYRFHPQLRQMLYQRVHRRAPQTVQSLHRQAAQWLLQQRCYTEAVHQLGRAQDFNALLSALEHHSFDLLREGKINAVMDFLEDIPGYTADDHLTLAITEASVVAVINHIQRATNCLSRMNRLLRFQVLSPQRLGRSWQTVAFLRSRLAYLGGNYAHGIALVGDALRDYPQANAATAVLLFNRGSNLFALGQLRLARRDTEQALAEIEPLHFSGYNNLLHWQLGQIELAQGQHQQAQERFNRLAALPAAERGHGYYDLFHFLGRAVVALQSNRLEQAVAHLAKAETLSLAFPQCAGLPWVLHYQAACLLASGKLEQARTRWDEARRLARSCKLFGLYRQIGAQRVRLAVRERDQDYILAWLKEWHWCNRRYASALPPEEWLAYAWVQRHLGQHLAVGKIVAELHEQALTEGNQHMCLELHILTAMLHQDRGERTAALHSLDQALLLAAGPAVGCLLHQEGRALDELWRQLLAPAARRQHELHQPLPARELLADLLRALGGPNQVDQLLVEPLTRREQDVLRRIAQGQHNQQIADGLFISLSTVKTHINNLFRKLDVLDRDSAIQVARQLNLLGGEGGGVIPPG